MPSSSKVNRRARTFRILRLFFSLVLDFLFQYLRRRVVGRTYHFFEDTRHNRQRAIKIRTAALQMGGVLIKVGQFLSSRVDLLPTEYIEELALLQDEVPPVPFAQIQAVVEEDFQARLGDVFAEFDREPVAAASLGQVHRGVLASGEVVAVKVQRPNIGDIVEADLSALAFVVRWLDRYTPIHRRANLPLIYREFEDTLRMELDYLLEGHHAERFGLLFDASPEIAVPRIFWSHTTRRVLTMQYMWGIKVTDFPELDRQGVGRTAVAETLLRSYLTQVIEEGFFQADPHPGNIAVRPGPVVVFLDFGMVGEMAPGMRDSIRRVFLGVIRRDYDEILTALVRLGFIAPGADMQVLKQALMWTIDTFYEMSFADLKAVDPSYVLDHLQEVLYSESFQIPANFAFLGRALGTLSGLCTALDPDFQFVSVAEPFARRLLQRPGVAGTLEQLAQEARSLAGTVYSLPYLSHHLLTRFENTEYTFRHRIDEVVHAVNRLEIVMRRLLYAIFVAGFLLTGAYIFQHYAVFAFGAFLLAVIFLLAAFNPFRRSG